MARVSPLGNLHEMNQASIFTIGAEGPTPCPIDIVAMHESIELEYAALRRRSGLMDRPDRAVLRVTGDDKLDFLNSMLTQELKDLPASGATRSFWLNRKGRVDADLLVVVQEDCVLLECHTLCAQRARETLESYVIADDVEIEDVSERSHRLSMHGPDTLARVGSIVSVSLATLAPDRATTVSIEGVDVTLVRQDTLGACGLEMLVPVEGVERVWGALLEHEGEGFAPVRAVGWHAWNIARVESGIAEYLIDFSSDSLPHETGVIEDRVSFTKGCYLGQEVVARMDARGVWKRQLRALRCTRSASDIPEGQPLQPVTGERVCAHGTDDAIGGVTSSVASPMLGDVAICFAMLERGAVEAGELVDISAQGTTMEAIVQEGLVFVEATSAS
ncbi:MAG: YgfZ/GcvT domain-containing protein [Phycisphaerales bacterium JB043]